MPSMAAVGTLPRHSGDKLQSHQMRLLQTSAQLQPESADPDRQRTTGPRNPFRTPPYYPQQAPAHFSLPAFFSELDTDTLFFIFYYTPGTYQQYLAARELKKQAWRFHKKFLTWFQRHEEPKVSFSIGVFKESLPPATLPLGRRWQAALPRVAVSLLFVSFCVCSKQIITDEYEQGTYVFFDFDQLWCQVGGWRSIRQNA